MKTGDSRAKGGPGFLPLQGHNRRWKIDQRPAVLAYRLVDRKDAFGELGQWVYDESTVGDLNLGLLWDIHEGTPTVRGGGAGPINLPKPRSIPGWAFAWPVITIPATGGTQLLFADVTTPPGKGGVATPPGGGGVKTPAGGGGPTIGPSVASGPGGGTANPSQGGSTVASQPIPGKKRCEPAANNIVGYPIGDIQYTPDSRYRSKSFKGVPVNKNYKKGLWPKFPSGWVGIALTTTEEYEQNELFFPTDPRLVAVNVAGDPVMGSLVCDLTSQWEVDHDRMARLQSAFRVVKKPKSFPVGIVPTQNLFAKDLNTLAWQMRPAGCDGSGWGMFADAARRVYPGDTNYHDINAIERFIGGMASSFEMGPFHVGLTVDKHRLGADADGNPINSLHLSTRAYFIDAAPAYLPPLPDNKETPSEQDTKDRDGPLFFEGDYAAGDTYTHTSLVHLGFESEPKHPFILGRERKGFWKWWAEVPFTTVSPSPVHQSPTPTPWKPFKQNESPSPSPVKTGGSPSPTGGSPSPTGDSPSPTGGSPSPNGPTRPDTKKPFVGTHMQVGTPGLCAWPQNYATNLPNYAANANIGQAAAAKIKSTTPITGQIDSYGAQGGLVEGDPYVAGSYVGASGDPWVYTQYPGPTSKFAGGTANGGYVMLPPQVSLSDEGTGYEPPGITLSTTYFIAGPNTYWGAGLPELANGAMRVGYSWGVDDTTGDLIYRSHGSAPDDAVRFTNTAQNIGWTSGTNFWGTLDHAITADRTWTFPNETATVLAYAALTFDGTFLNNQAIQNGPNGYTGYYVQNFGTGTAHAIYQAAVPAGGGDCFLLLQTDFPALVQYALGIDNSDDDSYKLTVKGAGVSVLPGDATGTNIYRVDRTTGNIRFDANIQWLSGTAFTGTLDHAIGADRTWTFPDATGTVPLGTGTLNQVVIWSATNTQTSNANLTFDGTIFTVATHWRGGTVTDTATAGDWATGLFTAARTFYDQSAATHYWYNASNTISNQISAVAATNTIFNETGLDIDHRFEGVGDANLLSLDAGLAAIGIGIAAATEDKVFIVRTGTGTGPGSIICLRADYTANPSAASTASHIAFYTECDSATANAQDFTGGTLGAFIADSVHRGTGTLTATTCGQNRSIKALGSGPVTTAEAFRPNILNQSAGTITLGMAIHIVAPTNSGGGTITTYEGMRIADSTVVGGITNNYALRILGGDAVFNENGVASDFRVEGDSLTYMLFLNGSASTLENIAFLTTAEPNWQTMNRGLFVGDVTTAPTGNPAAGCFAWSATGTFKTRSSGGLLGATASGINKTADQSVTNSTVLVNDTHLTASLTATTTYTFRFVTFVTSLSATAGFKVSLAGTATATSIKAQIYIYDDLTNALAGFARIAALGGVGVGAGLGAGDAFAIVEGTIEVNGAGTFLLQWAQNVADAVNATTVQRNSKLELIPVG